MNTKLPSVTFVTCTYNSQSTIKTCLESVKKLDYPTELIEVIVVDEFSKDKTVEIVKKYSFCKLIQKHTSGPEAATAIGYQQAKNDYVVNFPSDNVILDPQWLKRMIKPLQEDKTIFGVETMHYSHIKNDKILNRYFSLFGVNDPIAFYLNKRDRATHFENSWHLDAPAEDRGDYYVATFTVDNLPTVGANGFMYRKAQAKMISRDPELFFHIDTYVDLIEEGYNKIAFVKNDIWHKTGEEFWPFIKRRLRYVTTLYFEKRTLRRYHLFNIHKDRKKLFLFIFYSLTFIEPLYQAIRGYSKKPDIAWFLHPVMCFAMTLIYTYAVFNFELRSFLQRHERV